jgi:hypothetical protein
LEDSDIPATLCPPAINQWATITIVSTVINYFFLGKASLGAHFSGLACDLLSQQVLGGSGPTQCIGNICQSPVGLGWITQQYQLIVVNWRVLSTSLMTGSDCSMHSIVSNDRMLPSFLMPDGQR